MIITKMSLPRRTFLRGVGATLALPLLDAMVPALSATANAAAKGPKRFGALYAPNGIQVKEWIPKTTGFDFQLSPTLEPLAAFKDNLVVVSGLKSVGSAAHTGASAEFLSAVGVRRTDTDGTGTSIDQLLAAEYGKETQLASLELALDNRDGTGSCDGQSCSLSNSIAWRTPTLLLPMENDPRIVFERMFGDSGTTDTAVRLRALRRDRSLLDSVVTTVADLQKGLGPTDRHKVDEYLESVRDVERRIQRAEEQSSRELPIVPQPAGVPRTTDEHAKLMLDLQLLAYQCDLTRVVTFMLGREYSARAYPELGVAEAHHPLSHHQNNLEKIANCVKVNTYHVSLFAYLLEKMKATQDGDGTLLDNTLMFYGAGMSDGNSHDQTNLPLCLVGGKHMVKGGQHLSYPGKPSGNLLRTIAERMGVPQEKIGNSDGELEISSLSEV